jgi:acetylglutamate kinase
MNTLVKLGGAALRDPSVVQSICSDLARIQETGLPLVVVHGGGPDINQELESRGIRWEFRDGQRVTTPEMMEIIEMVLCGRVNRRLVRAMNGAGARVTGFSGADSRTLLCGVASPELGRVGEVRQVHAGLIELLIAGGILPVVAPIGVDREGHALNINADWAASRIAQALGCERVVFMTDQPGVLDSQGALVPELSPAGIKHLIATQVVKGGMLTKVRAVQHALESGASEVTVLNAREPRALTELLLEGKSIGTRCSKEVVHG